MLKKITTVISTNHKVWARKAVVMGGVTLGIGIGLLLSKVEDPEVVVVEEKTVDEEDFRSSARDVKDLTAEELEQAGRNTVGE